MSKIIRIIFGIFMVIVYLGMAALLFSNYFDWSTTGLMLVFRYVMAAIFALYGIYRCYRLVNGVDYYRGGHADKDDDRYGYYKQDDNKIDEA
ncbi:MAG: hypothetical protein IJ808_01660 [Muribaculaceae bacterium]|nr:hypothetical protein [Muribaculaceae bacterium]